MDRSFLATWILPGGAWSMIDGCDLGALEGEEGVLVNGRQGILIQ